MTWAEVYHRLEQMPTAHCYGVPRGGQVVAGLLGSAVETPEAADAIVDDIIDSGRTEAKWKGLYPEKPFVALVDKRKEQLGWVVFPWERETLDDIGENITRILCYIGEKPDREGLLDTPQRVVKSWQTLYGGYNQSPAEILARQFDAKGYDEMVVLKDIEFYSTCEHHMIPFFGKAHIGYIPNGKIVGISKLARLLECYARRLQVQEVLTKQIAHSINDILRPKGVGVVIEAQHLCMLARGVAKQNSVMKTSCLLGALLEKGPARAEFFDLIK